VEFHRQKGTVILVTHGKMADSFADRIIHLKNGRIK
jgi:ABC-type lipoprotein export system ATPase subunit